MTAVHLDITVPATFPALRGILDYLEPRFRGPIVIGESSKDHAWDAFENFGYQRVVSEYRKMKITLVDFNDQRRGRLALIRHLIDVLPETTVPEALVEFPPLGHAPLKERFKGALRPI